MKPNKTSHKIILPLFVLTALAFFVTQNAFSQTENLGIVRYTPPKGMNKTLKENVVAFSEFNQTTGTYCIITVYGATSGTGNAQSDFTREWNNLVVKALDKAEASPKTDTSAADGWTIIAGGSAVESGAGKALAFLTVITGSGKTVSILAVFNDPAYAKQVDTFISGLDLDKPTQTAAAVPLALDVDGHIIMPEPTRPFSVADLAGVWEEGGRSSTSYVFQSSGAHAGTDSLAIRIARTIERDGTYSSDFFSIRNGKKERDITTGSITIVGRVLTVRRSNSSTTDKYVIRGWLETPTATILRLAEGPWHNDDVIPQDRFTDFTDFGRFFTKTHWIRKK